MALCQLVYRYSATICNYSQHYPVSVMPNNIGNNALDRRISKGLFTFTPLHPYHLYCKQTGGFICSVYRPNSDDHPLFDKDTPTFTALWPDFCLQSPHTDPCKAKITRYIYNTKSGIFESFVFGSFKAKKNNVKMGEDHPDPQWCYQGLA